MASYSNVTASVSGFSKKSCSKSKKTKIDLEFKMASGSVSRASSKPKIMFNNGKSSKQVLFNGFGISSTIQNDVAPNVNVNVVVTPVKKIVKKNTWACIAKKTKQEYINEKKAALEKLQMEMNAKKEAILKAQQEAVLEAESKKKTVEEKTMKPSSPPKKYISSIERNLMKKKAEKDAAVKKAAERASSGGDAWDIGDWGDLE